jgi:uncharacterized membrane protein YdbT with pleckstrin-like domain
MPYPRKLLNDHETVALDLHPHWWFFAKPAIALFASIVLGIFALTQDGDAGTSLQVLSMVLIVVTGLWTVHRYLKWATTNFVITSDRIIFRSGILAKSGIEIPLERVNNVLFNQGVFERIIGAGDLLIESGGEDGQQRFSDIRGPERVQKLIHAQIEANKSHRVVPPPQQQHGSVTDVASQLAKLEGMVERGTLSREEFDAQKRKLLG